MRWLIHEVVNEVLINRLIYEIIQKISKSRYEMATF